MTRNVNALLQDPQYERLRQAAFESRRSMTDILREALEDWLNRRDREGRTTGAQPEQAGETRVQSDQ
jgi:hypothetical protein